MEPGARGPLGPLGRSGQQPWVSKVEDGQRSSAAGAARDANRGQFALAATIGDNQHFASRGAVLGSLSRGWSQAERSSGRPALPRAAPSCPAPPSHAPSCPALPRSVTPCSALVSPCWLVLRGVYYPRQHRVELDPNKPEWHEQPGATLWLTAQPGSAASNWAERFQEKTDNPST